MTTETLPTVVPLEPTTPIKPSEAIRLGCLIAPQQAFNHYLSGDGAAACALGAAALGWNTDPVEAQFLIEDVLLPRTVCPEPGCTDGHFGWPAILNDTHRWSRERIADWLEGLGL